MSGKPQRVADQDLTVPDATHDLLHELEQARTRIAELQTALDSRVVIEQAKGILRERFGWPVGEAFEILRYAARSSRANIHTLSRAVVENERTPNAIVVAIARSARWRAAHMRERSELQRARAELLESEIRAQQERLMWESDRNAGPGRQPPPTFVEQEE